MDCTDFSDLTGNMSQTGSAEGTEWGFEFINAEDVKDYVVEHGVSGIEKLLQKKLEEWKSVPLNMAITGSSGSGKSSFINAIRGLTAEDEGAAIVDVVEATTVPTSYPHPNNTNLAFWDLPGVGTPRFPKESYLEAVDFEKYDFFLILSSERFRENDLWLAKEIEVRNKKFFFVRTKIDSAVDDDRRSHPKSHTETNVLEKIRQNCDQNFQQANLPGVIVFLVSNFSPTKWDFPNLAKHMIEDLPSLKREAMTLSLSTLTSDVVKQKRQILQSRIWKVATMSAVGGAIPIPGASFAVDLGLLMNEMSVYRQQFGLDDESLERIAETSGVSKEYLKQNAMAKTGKSFFTREGITAMLIPYSTQMVGEEAARFIPFIGSILAGGISFYTTYSMLNDMLDKMEEDALQVLEVTMKGSTNV